MSKARFLMHQKILFNTSIGKNDICKIYGKKLSKKKIS